MAKAMQDAIILFGDSMTEAQDVDFTLQSAMSAAYSRKLDVLNRGFSGYNTDECVLGALSLIRRGRVMLDECLAKKTDAQQGQRVLMVTVWHGTNDADIHPGSVCTPLPTFTAKLHHFLSSLTSPSSPYAIADTPVSIVLIGLHPIFVHMRPGFDAPGYVQEQDADRQREFRDAVLQVGKEWKEKEKDPGCNTTGWKVEVLDLWAVMVQEAGGEGAEKLEKYYTDGTHFNATGYKLLWKALSALIRDNFKGRGLDPGDVEDLPPRAPL